ncbi:hypothetical protein [Micromonospora sp. NPDC002717]|uniref:hypothetical protein n=1 Tax=Micromonospora sp. NPDC002717 TaxID=3154424 RepID=UPI00332F0F2C
MALPVIRFALPLASEVRWSDMLAVMLATDPVPLGEVLGLSGPLCDVVVHREVAVDPASQPDIIIELQGQRIAVIEVKVLAGLGTAQLERYADAVPDAAVYVLVFPSRLVIDVGPSSGWRMLTWETLLDAYQTSKDSWVATCATAWREHLDRALPTVDAATVWNDLVPGEDFVIALRARMSWLHGQLAPPPPIHHDLVSSSAGVSWVVRLYTEAAEKGYLILVEVEENLPVRDFPKYLSSGSRQPRGPSIKVCLQQQDITTSAGYNWHYLAAMWPLMQGARGDWVTNPARPKAPHDKAGHQEILAGGAPPYLGIGFGEAQAKISGACMFGARIQLPATISLGEVSQELSSLYDLIIGMARVLPPTKPQ